MTSGINSTAYVSQLVNFPVFFFINRTFLNKNFIKIHDNIAFSGSHFLLVNGVFAKQQVTCQ